jgi:hypothetical protein
MQLTDDEQRYAIMGIAAVIPGFQRAIDLLTGQLDRMRAQLGALQSGTAEPASKFKRSRPKKQAKDATEVQRRASAYWAEMSPEERSAEMQRRLVVRKKKRKMSPEGREAIRNAQKKRWAATKKKPTVKMALKQEQLDKLHPRDARSPRHATWLKTMRNAQLKRWAGMSKAERKATQAAMAAGRQQHVNGEAHA